MLYYKFLNAHQESCHGGKGKWEIDKWMPVIDNPTACERGYHVVNANQLLPWLHATLWEVEVRGQIVESLDKTVASEARIVRQLTRWDDRVARLFAADCAERVLPLFTIHYPDEHRPLQAIHAARDFAQHLINDVALLAAREGAAAVAWHYNIPVNIQLAAKAAANAAANAAMLLYANDGWRAATHTVNAALDATAITTQVGQWSNESYMPECQILAREFTENLWKYIKGEK